MAFGQLDEGEYTCSCLCTPENVDCEMTVGSHAASDTMCDEGYAAYGPWELADGDCEDLDLEWNITVWWSAEPAANIGGSCVRDLNNKIDTPVWGDQLLRCSAASSFPEDGCDSGELCVPKTPPAFDGDHCIFAPGDVFCPTGSVYDEREVYYSVFQDDRGCETCNCGPLDGSCEGEVVVRSGQCGDTGGDQFGKLDEGDCQGLPHQAGDAQVTFEADIDDASCPKSGGGKNGNDVELGGTVTICCS